MKLEIKKAGINGEGIGFYKRKPFFVEGCFPDEIVDCKLYDEGNHYRGELIKIIKKSKYRINAVCPHQKRCGGCPLMTIEYEEQLRIKKQLLEGALFKYTGKDIDVGEITPSPDKLFYRNKCNLPVIEKDNRLVCAMYKQGSNHPVIIDNCFVHNETLEEVRIGILDVLNRHHYKAYDRHLKKGIRQIILRGFAEYQLTLITGNDEIDDKTVNELLSIDKLVSIYQGINTHRNPINMMPEHIKLLAGKEKINVKVGAYKLKLSPQAFYQLNHKQAENIYEKVSELIDERCDLIVEAYCGVGGISLYLHDKADKLIGIEIIPKAIKDAKENARINKIDNIEFICDDASKAIRKITKNKKIDVLVVDPPRTGLDDDFLTTLIKSKINKIIYVSCNPATLSKDIDLLSKKYQIEYIEGYDMFPNTAHVETIVLLTHKK